MDGHVVDAELPPAVFRQHFIEGQQHWREAYVYLEGRTTEHPNLGALPIMAFLRRDPEP